MSQYARVLVNLRDDEHRGELLQKLRRLGEHASQVELFSCLYSAGLASSHLFDADGRQHAIQAVLRKAEKGLMSHVDKLQQRGLTAGADVYWDRDQAEGIVRKVLRYQPDLVLHAPEHHANPLQRLLSAPDWRLLRQCPAPLLLSKKPHWNDRPIIAAAIDPFHLDDEAAALDHRLLAHAAGLAQQLDGELHVLHVFQTLPHSAIFDEHLVLDYEALQQRVRAEHHTRIDELIAPYGLSVQDPCVHLLEGELHQLVPQWAQDNQIDVLAMGSQARGFLDRMLLGSSAERLLDKVGCDLLVLKPDSFHCPVTEF
ncbi:MAG: universal stress protein [Oceanospirillales bacterium]|uniref:Universal stress protein E n=1 Tax=Marinobacterium halophilum TaxID=267374 RepID=A0A2P8F0E4_9GAMM|nr:universal stress protein [Marinobacterium halophilum]MBR9829714.1 universal stress protein [Oceanospirillales bacterium]PSL15192.1 universal stress protein E [Marinobacterium halophilum]